MTSKYNLLKHTSVNKTVSNLIAKNLNLDINKKYE